MSPGNSSEQAQDRPKRARIELLVRGEDGAGFQTREVQSARAYLESRPQRIPGEECELARLPSGLRGAATYVLKNRRTENYMLLTDQERFLWERMDGRASLQQAYADVRGNEAWLVGAHISVYDQGNRENHDPDRDRKLLLRRKEIDSLAGKVRERGLTLVPTKLYFRDGRAKVELALARGKELRDKRRDLQKREAQRDMERALKSRR